MSKFTLTIDGNEATLDFGEETQADGSMIHRQLPISVTHLRVRGHKVTTLGDHFVVSAFLDVTHIGDEFLYGCKNLTSVDLSYLNNVTKIGDEFLYGCKNLTSVDLSYLNNVTKIGDEFLYWCENLTSVDLPNFKNVTHIGDGFLEGCKNLTSVDLRSLSNVTHIGDDFLRWCKNLTSVDLTPLKDVTHIGDGFLWGCDNLQEVDLTPLEKNFPDIRKRFPYLPHTPTLKENKIIDKEKLNRELFIACRSDLVNAASMLIEAGADVNYVAQNMVGRGEEKKWTCLHEAVAMSRPEIVQLLLKHGALTVKDENDRTPLDIAIYTQDKDIIRILMKHEG